MPPPVLTPTNVTVNRTVPVERPMLKRVSSEVTVEEVFRKRVLAEPLVPVDGTPSAAENAELLAALDQFAGRVKSDDASALEAFLSKYPDSAWSVSLLNNLGDFYRRTGQFSDAINAYQRSWSRAGNLQDATGKALADQALGQLAELRARMGQTEELEVLLQESQGRVLTGASTEAFVAAKETQWRMKHDPDASFGCGLVALAGVKKARNIPDAYSEELLHRRSKEKGFKLAELNDLARAQGLDYEAVKLSPGAELSRHASSHCPLEAGALRLGFEKGGRSLPCSGSYVRYRAGLGYPGCTST